MIRIAPVSIAGLLAALACAGGGEDSPPRVLASTPGDSAGWRAVSVPALGLRLQYPESHVRAVVDRSTRDCASVPPLPAAAWDSAGGDTLVVTTAPSNFDSVAVAMGFDVQPDGSFWHREDSLYGTAWTNVDSMRAGGWRALTAVAENRLYFDDMNYAPDPGEEDVTMPPETIWQERFFAAAPGPAGCVVVLAWRSHVVRPSKEGFDAGRWAPEMLETFLRRATLAPKPGGAGSRQ